METEQDKRDWEWIVALNAACKFYGFEGVCLDECGGPECVPSLIMARASKKVPLQIDEANDKARNLEAENARLRRVLNIYIGEMARSLQAAKLVYEDTGPYAANGDISGGGYGGKS